MAAVLDVVYNHFGPEGNYAGDFGPYFTDRYQTPWGRAINFDGPDSDAVREFFIENARYWFREFHFDALRLDALHAILDTSARPFLAELVDSIEEERSTSGRRLYLIGESDLNDPRLVRRREIGGIALDAQWNDDFHHALHVPLTGERTGYYADFGQLEQLADAYRRGFVYTGQYSAHRRRRHGDSSSDIPAGRFVVFAQNHDQVGNRLRGDRLSPLISFESLKLAAACVILSPYLPLLFMGEEYGETAPFPYFVSHSDPDLIDAIRKGRSAEFVAFHWEDEPPDPQAIDTFESARLNWGSQTDMKQETLWCFYRELISLRHVLPVLSPFTPRQETVRTSGDDTVLLVTLGHEDGDAALIFNFGETDTTVQASFRMGVWHRRLDSSDNRWMGSGSLLPELMESSGSQNLHLRPRSAVLILRETES